MKNKYLLVAVMLVIFLTSFQSCKKGTTESITPNLAVGNWIIHHIYVRTYQNSTFIRDTTLKNLPQPNYVNFNSNGTLEYRYNEPSAETGTYQLKGPDSIYAVISGKTYKWKIDLLITTNFNVQTTTYNYPTPGANFETYQSFIR